MLRKLVALACLCVQLNAGNNGLAERPPMKWRSWNQFGFNISESVILDAAYGLTDTSRAIVGMPAGSSLFDLGYDEVGMDEGWAGCTAKPGWPTGNWAYHRSNPDGSVSPVINSTLFPNMTHLVSTIHQMGLLAGWYLNDCLSYCFELGDKCDDKTCSPGDVQAWANAGFDSLKLDGCSSQRDIHYWATLLNATGTAALVENCNNGQNPTKPIVQGGCPDYHMYRVSTDIRNTYGSFMQNAQYVGPYAADGRHGPSCWCVLCVHRG
jgi:alpha-galactosidase